MHQGLLNDVRAMVGNAQAMGNDAKAEQINAKMVHKKVRDSDQKVRASDSVAGKTLTVKDNAPLGRVAKDKDQTQTLILRVK